MKTLKLYYKSSAEEPLLQFIDFVAFTINRVRWIQTNNSKKDIDIEFLRIAENANFNILNIKKRLIDVHNIPDMVQEYDSILREAYDKNNNLSDIQLEEFKNVIANS